MSYNHFLTGVTLVKDGERLGYPFIPCIESMLDTCDEVIVNVGISTDNTGALVQQLVDKNRERLHMRVSGWNMSNTGDGRELAKQANCMLPFVRANSWVLYLQADEMIHEEDVVSLRTYLDSLPSNVTQVELLRTYFWKNLNTRASKYEIYLGRIFRAGTHLVGGDGMYLIRQSGDIIRSSYWIYHYSRMGPEEKVHARIRNLDKLFHSEEEIETLPMFKYEQELDLIDYNGSHPPGIIEFYGSRS